MLHSRSLGDVVDQLLAADLILLEELQSVHETNQAVGADLGRVNLDLALVKQVLSNGNELLSVSSVVWLGGEGNVAELELNGQLDADCPVSFTW